MHAPRLLKYSNRRFLRAYVLSNDALAQGKTTMAGASPASWKAASLISLASLFDMFSPPRKYNFAIQVMMSSAYFKGTVLSAEGFQFFFTKTFMPLSIETGVRCAGFG